jgi:hypothetical protein
MYSTQHLHSAVNHVHTVFSERDIVSHLLMTIHQSHLSVAVASVVLTHQRHHGSADEEQGMQLVNQLPLDFWHTVEQLAGQFYESVAHSNIPCRVNGKNKQKLWSNKETYKN